MSRLFKWFKLNFIGTRKELISAILVIAFFVLYWYLQEYHGIDFPSAYEARRVWEGVAGWTRDQLLSVVRNELSGRDRLNPIVLSRFAWECLGLLSGLVFYQASGELIILFNTTFGLGFPWLRQTLPHLHSCVDDWNSSCNHRRTHWVHLRRPFISNCYL